MKDIFAIQETPEEINKKIAKRVQALRKSKGLTQLVLSEKSGVSLGSIKRFERTGDVSLLSLSKIAIALEVESDLQEVFTKKQYQSIEEIINEGNQ